MKIKRKINIRNINKRKKMNKIIMKINKNNKMSLIYKII